MKSENNPINLMEFFKPGDAIFEHSFSYNKKDGLKIKSQSPRITIYTNKVNLSYVEELISEYRALFDIYIEDCYIPEDIIKIKVNDGEVIVKQIS